MRIPNQTLVLVADGRKMLFLRNEGDETYPDLRVEAHREQDNPSNREQSTDAPGRAATGNFRTNRSGMEETDFHQIAEDRFAAEASELLRKRALANDFEQLIIAAPPRTLGELRKHYHSSVEQRLIGEVDKDLTGMPIPDIEKALAG